MAEKERFSSRWGFILSVMGAAIGTGNIWRFPREAAMNGGGAFMIPWFIFLFLWSIPLLMAEFAIGKKTRLGTIGSFKYFTGEKYTWMGAWMAWVNTAIGFYYAVVMGWTIRYCFVASTGQLTPETDTAALWGNFIGNPAEVMFWQAIAMCISAFFVIVGVKKGIEVSNRVLIPTLIIFLVIAALWSLTLPGAIEGLKFLYIPRVEYLYRGETWIRALSHSAWSTSAGMGMGITYAVYISKKEDVSLNSFMSCLGNNCVELISGVAVLCTVFALSASTADGLNVVQTDANGLTFIHLTRLFVKMPFGIFIAAIFFLATSFAALTSMTSGLEATVRNFMDHGWSRKKAVIVVSAASFVLGIPCAFSLQAFNNQDTVWGLALIVSGMFTSFAVVRYGAHDFRTKLINTKWSDLYIGRWYEVVIRYIFPIEFVVVISWWLWQSYAENPDTWWDPSGVGLGAVLLQWCVALAVLYLLNGWFVENVKKVEEQEEVEEDEDVPGLNTTLLNFKLANMVKNALGKLRHRASIAEKELHALDGDKPPIVETADPAKE